VPFGVVRGVGRGTRVLDGVVIVNIVERKGVVLGLNLRLPIVTNGDFAG